MGAPDVVRSYKRLSRVEQDLEVIKGDDVSVRPSWRHRDDRVTAHVLICMLAAYLAWHLRRAWARLMFACEHPDPCPDVSQSAAGFGRGGGQGLDRPGPGQGPAEVVPGGCWTIPAF
jgi:hypothetical protein